MSASQLKHPVALDEPILVPVLGERFALGWKHLVMCVWFASFFMYLNYIPLFHSDIWGHVLYGKWILEHRLLPQEDPFLPLAAGMRVVDNAWLSQVLIAWAVKLGGAQYLSNLFALTVLASYLLQCRVFYLFSGRISLALGGMAMSFFIGWSRHAIIRPEIFGFLCFSLLLWMMVRLEPWRSRAKMFSDCDASDSRFPRWLWVALPLLFVFWANAHGSFAVGLLVLGCHLLGRIIEVAWRQRSFTALCADQQTRSWILMTELATAGTLINPYGLDLLINTASFGSNPNLRDVLEWFPLKLVDLEGIQFAMAVVWTIVLLRHSRQKVCPADVVVLLVFSALTAPAIRMIGWLAPLLAFTMMPHITNIYDRLRPGKSPWVPSRIAADELRPQPRFAVTLVCLLVAWCAFALSPISQPFLGGKPRKPSQLYSRHTPLEIAEFLRKTPPEGLVFVPQWWGEWLIWQGSPHMKAFMTTNVHLVPSRVWRDYLRVTRGDAQWEDTLDRYAVKTVVAHKELQGALTHAIRRSRQWRVVYEDEQGIVATRADAP